MVRAPVLLVVGLLVSVSAAGCIGDEAAKPEKVMEDVQECSADGVCAAAPVLDEAGRDLRTGLTAEDVLEVPEWSIGDVFEQHVYYGSSDTAGEHIVTMVVSERDGDCYQLGTTSTNAAKTEATYDLPVLGCIGIENLETTALGVDWSWMYEFPLEDGKTWAGSIDGIFNWNQNSFHSFEFTITVSYDPAIDTPRGDFPGFWLSGKTVDGSELLSYNYVPAVGWFSHFWMWDITTDDDPDDVMFHAMSMGTSKGFTGTYYIDEAEDVINSFMFPVAALPGFEDADPIVQSFVVEPEATYLKGVVVAFACPGVSEVRLVDPANNVEAYSHTYEGDPQACAEEPEEDVPQPEAYTINWFDDGSKPGEWRVAVAGAGVFGAYVWLMAVTEKAYDLEATPEA